MPSSILPKGLANFFLSDAQWPLPIDNFDGFICGLTDLDAAMPCFPRVGEMRHAGLKTEEEKVLREVADDVTKTARPTAHPWNGKSRIDSQSIAKRNRSDCGRECIIGPISPKVLRERDPNGLGWLIQEWNPNMASHGEARVLFINGLYVHTTTTLPSKEGVETRPSEFIPLDMLRCEIPCTRWIWR